MLDKIDLRAIVIDHFRTLRRFSKTTVSKSDIAIFYGVPVLGAIVLTYALNVEITSGAVSVMITAVAILAGLLLNLLMLMHGLLLRGRMPEASTDERQLLEEIYANIAYTVLICLIAVGVLAALSLVGPTGRVRDGLAAFSYLILLHLMLTLLMVLKRVHVLLGREFKT